MTRTPDAVALSFDGRQMSYGELDDASDLPGVQSLIAQARRPGVRSRCCCRDRRMLSW